MVQCELRGVAVSWDAPTPNIPRVEGLALDGCAFEDKLFHLLQYFPRLASLKAVYLNFPSESGFSDLEPQIEEVGVHPPFTGELVMIEHSLGGDQVSQRALLHILTLFPEGVHFNLVRIENSAFNCVDALSAILKSCGPRLQWLNLRLCLICEFASSCAATLSYAYHYFLVLSV